MVHTGITGRQAGESPQKDKKGKTSLKHSVSPLRPLYFFQMKFLCYQQRSKLCGQKAHSCGHFQPITLVSIHDSTLTPHTHHPFGGTSFEEILTLIINFPSLYVLSAMPPYPFIQPSFPPIFHKFTQNPPSQCFELETFTLG